MVTNRRTLPSRLGLRAAAAVSADFHHIWRVRTKLPDRLRQRCRILARGRMNSVLIEIESDGWKAITSRNLVKPKGKTVLVLLSW